VELSTEIQGVSNTTLNTHITTPPDPVAEGGDEGRRGTEASSEEYTSHIREDEK